MTGSMKQRFVVEASYDSWEESWGLDLGSTADKDEAERMAEQYRIAFAAAKGTQHFDAVGMSLAPELLRVRVRTILDESFEPVPVPIYLFEAVTSPLPDGVDNVFEDQIQFSLFNPQTGYSLLRYNSERCPDPVSVLFALSSPDEVFTESKRVETVNWYAENEDGSLSSLSIDFTLYVSASKDALEKRLAQAKK